MNYSFKESSRVFFCFVSLSDSDPRRRSCRSAVITAEPPFPLPLPRPPSVITQQASSSTARPVDTCNFVLSGGRASSARRRLPVCPSSLLACCAHTACLPPPPPPPLPPCSLKSRVSGEPVRPEVSQSFQTPPHPLSTPAPPPLTHHHPKPPGTPTPTPGSTERESQRAFLPTQQLIPAFDPAGRSRGLPPCSALD